MILAQPRLMEVGSRLALIHIPSPVQITGQLFSFLSLPRLCKKKNTPKNTASEIIFFPFSLHPYFPSPTCKKPMTPPPPKKNNQNSSSSTPFYPFPLHPPSRSPWTRFLYGMYNYLHLLSLDLAGAEEEEESKWKKRCLYCIDLFCWWDCCWPWVKFAKAIEWFIMDAFIDLFITLCIVVNTIFMALDHNSMSLEFERTLKTGNYVSSIVLRQLGSSIPAAFVFLYNAVFYDNHYFPLILITRNSNSLSKEI